MGGEYEELVVVGLAAFLLAVLVGGAIVLAAGGRGRVVLPGPSQLAHRLPETLAPGWRWQCCGCERYLDPLAGPDLPVNYTVCFTCEERYKARGELARQKARGRENGHA